MLQVSSKSVHIWNSDSKKPSGPDFMEHGIVSIRFTILRFVFVLCELIVVPFAYSMTLALPLFSFVFKHLFLMVITGASF